MRKSWWLAIVAPIALLAQSHSMEIVVERQEGGVWASIDPGLVLGQGDLVRFRFRTTFEGYLYVINSGTSGTQSLLFPGEATGVNNRVARGRGYFVPSTGASFKVAGPAGHDVVYWLISPVPLGGDPAAALGRPKPPSSNLMPRCDDSIFRARGLCIDSSAGARNVGPSEQLPDAIQSVPNLVRRELIIVQEKDKSRVSAPATLAGPAVYEFRLAHN